MARALGQHQHVRARIAHRHSGGQGGRGPARVPPPAISPTSTCAACWRRWAKQFGWRAGRTPERAWGRRGLRVLFWNAYVATMAEIAVNKGTGAVQIKRRGHGAGRGPGLSIPTACARQMEGSITMGLGYTLTEEVRFKEGKCSTATSTATSFRVSRGCPRSRPSSSITPTCPRWDAANRPSSPRARWSPTPSTTP